MMLIRKNKQHIIAKVKGERVRATVKGDFIDVKCMLASVCECIAQSLISAGAGKDAVHDAIMEICEFGARKGIGEKMPWEANK